MLLVIWELWEERNARVFMHHGRSAPLIIESIKGKALVRIVAGDAA
ncbi:hypothetical protein HU200_007109 [Digitaria exilis]|uniref:Uncharacterized protein n=1 Tax=Digitaria exilis TaxID=1010633 RepID=A0A835KRB2_9POAL|nr:hypothetical protein HU200_007109 [Digitaria exilis]